MRSFFDLLGALNPSLERGIRFGSAGATLVPYQQLWERAARQASTVEARLRPGDRVLLVGDNSQAQVEALLACWWLGLVPVCVAPPARLSPGAVYRDNLENWAKQTGARFGWCEPELLERCLEARAGLDWEAFPLLFAEGPPAERRAVPDENLAYIQFSSGTTHQPHPVRLTGHNLSHNIQAILSVFPQPLSQHSCVSWLPLYHDMGLVGSLLSALAAPGNLVLMRPYQFAARPVSWFQALSESRATVSPAPNFALQQSLERVRDEQLEGVDLSYWQLALLGSETIHGETLRLFYERYRKFGMRWQSLTPVYGLAEATLAVTFSPPARGPRSLWFGESEQSGRELISLGPALPGIEVKIGDLGQILTRSASVAALSADQWLDTGDLGFLRDGELYLVGRSKDVIIVRGKNFHPEALEQALQEVEGLDPGRAAAVNIDGDLTLLVLAERRRKEVLPEQLQCEQARAAIARRTGLLVTVTLVEAGWLPRTTSGKVQRSASAAKYLEARSIAEPADGPAALDT